MISQEIIANTPLSESMKFSSYRYKKKDLEIEENNNKDPQSPTKLTNKIEENTMIFNSDAKNLTNTIFQKFSHRNFLFETKSPINYLKRFEFLHLQFKSKSLFSAYYILFFLVRQSLMSIISVILFYYSSIQIAIFNVFDLILIFYLSFVQPFNHIFHFISCLGSEIITELAFASGFVIGVFYFFHYDYYQARNQCGWVILYCNLVLLYWVIATGILDPLITLSMDYLKKRVEFRKAHVIIRIS